MTADDTTTSLYRLNAVAIDAPGGGPSDWPGTVMTHAVETVDNDRASAMLTIGVIR